MERVVARDLLKSPLVNEGKNKMTGQSTNSLVNRSKELELLMTQIDTIAENVCNEAQDKGNDGLDNGSPGSQVSCSKRMKTNDTARESAQKKTERTILETEKFRALIAEPPGEDLVMHNVVLQNMTLADNMVVPVSSDVVGVANVGLSDDNFFHLMCHVDNALIAEIEKGKFVKLEKMIPKDKRSRSDSNRLEWIQNEGSTYLAPVSDRVSKISNYRKWEQAFRVYATIYCGANPQRSREIWQYVTVISTAASSFVWENVYAYDITFRHLMAFNPAHSWAVTYNQMWNI